VKLGVGDEAAGASEDEAEFDAILKRIAKARSLAP
jgi:hypothetical protein